MEISVGLRALIDPFPQLGHRETNIEHSPCLSHPCDRTSVGDAGIAASRGNVMRDTYNPSEISIGTPDPC